MRDNIWFCTDPRLNVNKTSDIIIVRPMGEVGTGFVDVKNGWYIHTSFPDYSSIDDWDEDWSWTYAPTKYNTKKSL